MAARNKWKGIRAGSKVLDVYNEGRLVYLFDQASLPVLKKSEADFQSGFADEEAQADPELRKLAKAGTYVAYELYQDDEVRVEVVVGKPLTKKELAVGRWHKPQRAFLQLPSGKLRVHTPNTLPIHDTPTDKPGKADVPPGDYVVTLYRLDWDELKNDGVVSDDDDSEEYWWHGPQEVIVLTPVTQGKRVPANKSYLRFPIKSTDVWMGKYQITDGTFHGLGMSPFWWESICLNMDAAAVAALGLVPGMSFRVEMADFVFEVIYYGDADIMEALEAEWAEPLANGRPEFGVAYRLLGQADSNDYLQVQRVVAARPFPIHKRWMPVTVRILQERYAIPARTETSSPD